MNKIIQLPWAILGPLIRDYDITDVLLINLLPLINNVHISEKSAKNAIVAALKSGDTADFLPRAENPAIVVHVNGTGEFAVPVRLEAGVTVEHIVELARTAALVQTPRDAAAGGGLYVVYGGAASGKTRWLGEHCRNIWFVGEPDHRAMPFREAMRMLDAAATTRFETEQVVGIDSFKDLVYAANGAATQGGVSTGFFMELAELSRRLMGTNLHVLAIVNPSQEKVSDALYDALVGNCTGIIELKQGVPQRGAERVWNAEGNYYERRTLAAGEVFSFLKTPQGDRPAVSVGHTEKGKNVVYSQAVAKKLSQLINKNTEVIE